MDKVTNSTATQTTAAVDRSNSSDNPRASKKAKGKADQNDDFSGELAQADQAASSAKTTALPAANATGAKEGDTYTPSKAAENKLVKGGIAVNPAMTPATSLKGDMKRSGLTPFAGGIAPQAQKSNASNNTAEALAGLKPWSKDWVFDGLDGNPNLKGLLSKKEPTGADQKSAALNLPADLKQRLQDDLNGGQELPPEILKAAQAQWSELMSNSNQAMRQTMQPTRGDANGAAIPMKNGMDPTAMGVMPMMSGRMQASGKNASPLTANNNQQLSGGEFLTTLSAVKGGAQKSGADLSGEQGSNLGGQSDGKSSLNLLDGGLKNKKGIGQDTISLLDKSQPALAGASVSRFEPQTGSLKMQAAEVTGHVVQGAGTKERLSHESLLGISSQIGTFSPHGGGEMRVRLKPDNLGELSVRVMTQGNQVGLQIQASDDKAKRVIEESMSHLKESLAQQNLSLGKVEITVANSQTSQGEYKQDQGSSYGQQAFQDMMGGQNNAGQSNQGRGGWNGVESDFGQPARMAPAASRGAALGAEGLSSPRANSNWAGDGRIDVRA